ncbi:MAG: DNA-binding FadR family transcriptional regulator [Parasphingorhabdus sp.]|jgi:DNA-binding FadR family transcriptional regulator
MTDPDPRQQSTPGYRRQGSNSSANIANVLKTAIVEGQYAFNERLPPERDLAVEFGSSRGTVRSALQKLDAQNMVSRRIGSGTFVTYRGVIEHEDIERVVSPLELIEVRIAIEPHIARLAVLNATPRDLEKLETTLREVERTANNSEAFTPADAAFHLALAECTGNALMIWLYQHINSIRRHRQWKNVKDKILSEERIRRYNHTHREIYDAIRSRDADSAARFMTSHLYAARDDLQGVGKP